VLKREEERFSKTLEQGMKLLQDVIASLVGTEINKEIAFKLYDTYGFPIDLTADVAREEGLSVDLKGFEVAMNDQRARARKAGDFNINQAVIKVEGATQFLGYDQLENVSTVKALIKEGVLVDSIQPEDKAIVILEASSFYAESGGQVGDSGILSNAECTFSVHNTCKQKTLAFEHQGILKTGKLRVGDHLTAMVDKQRRKMIARNHSATHLLHAALRQVLGEGVVQKGSLVDEHKLRFDFSCDEPVGVADLNVIEAMVNRKILENSTIHTEVMDIEQAKQQGAMALFGEKYDTSVRVLTMGKDDFSVELCGGTHIKRLGDIGLFRIASEGGVSAGVRRIEALSGYQAYQFDKKIETQLNQITDLLKTNANNALEKTQQLIQQQKEMEKQLAVFQQKSVKTHGDALIQQAITVGDIQVLSCVVKEVQAKDLRVIVDRVKDKLSKAVIVLATINESKIALVAGVTKNLTERYQAGKILNQVANQVGGKAGGRADMAQGGGVEIENLNQALASVKDLI
jgi:alanyl-tRNA synthetase